MTPHLSTTVLLADVRELISSARQRVASTVNAELTQLYWQIGRRINQEVLQGPRAEYGKQVLAGLAQQLTTEFGKGWSERQLRYCLRIAETVPDERILHTLCAELSWSHLRVLIQIDDPLKRDFYIEICRVEHWSVRQLQERINSMLFERTAISKKPEDTIRQDLAQLREQGPITTDGDRVMTPRPPVIARSAATWQSSTRRLDRHGPAALAMTPYRLALHFLSVAANANFPSRRP